MGMSAAIGELRGQQDRKSIFDEVQFPVNGSNDESVISLETQALQTVYHFLTDCKLEFTLACLEHETRVKKERDAYHLIELLDADNDVLPEEDEEEDS